jgi:UDP:flavonoid glycosyltransferase YjiC (YdhE family)
MRIESIERRIAYFISPHGFGHAARAAAVMEAAHRVDEKVRFEIFTRVPDWFFKQSLTRGFGYHALDTDLGFVQRTPFEVDLRETLQRLDAMLPFDAPLVEGLARRVIELGCEAVVCDIAPMGILVAEAARLPSVLAENFTWDWIYEAYLEGDARLKAHADYLKAVFNSASHHIQTEPVCAPSAAAAMHTPPVSRLSRTPAEVTRKALGVPLKARLVLITMGGIPAALPFVSQLEQSSHIHFLIPGASAEPTVRNNLVLIPHASEFYHPDLLNAADAVVAKIGYSTVAEAFHADVPLLYVTRSVFRESYVLAGFVDREMRGSRLSEEDLAGAAWLPRLDELLSEAPRAKRKRPNGAPAIADFLVSLIDRTAKGKG